MQLSSSLFWYYVELSSQFLYQIKIKILSSQFYFPRKIIKMVLIYFFSIGKKVAGNFPSLPQKWQ